MRFLGGIAVYLLGALGLSGGAALAEPACENPNALGVSRTVEINTKGGPGFGLEQYKAYDFLQPKEVVLTFDDGPQKYSTEMVLEALQKECVRATFFSIGKMALGYPAILREVAHQGHTIGTHTWSHASIRKLKTFEKGRDEIERGISAVHRALGAPVAPFFRFPTLSDTPEAVKYLGERNIAMFSMDVDSFDFKRPPPKKLVASIMRKLEKHGKGIILLHDIHKNTAHAVPLLLEALKKDGYKIVHLTAAEAVTTLPEFDKAIEKDVKGLPTAGSERPMSSVVRTVGGDVPSEEKSEHEDSSHGESVHDGSSHDQPSHEPGSAAPAKPATGKGAMNDTDGSDGVAATEPAAAAPAESPVVATVPAQGEAVVAAKAPEAGGTVATASIKPAAGPGDAGEAPKSNKSLSQKAKELWEFWFGQ